MRAIARIVRERLLRSESLGDHMPRFNREAIVDNSVQGAARAYVEPLFIGIDPKDDRREALPIGCERQVDGAMFTKESERVGNAIAIRANKDEQRIQRVARRHEDRRTVAKAHSAAEHIIRPVEIEGPEVTGPASLEHAMFGNLDARSAAKLEIPARAVDEPGERRQTCLHRSDHRHCQAA